MIFFTADNHFDHANIIRYCFRPFKDKDEMNRAMITNWNLHVKKEDTVYVGGDFMFVKRKDAASVGELLRSLNGEKHLIVGNHDSDVVVECPEWKTVQVEVRKAIHGVPVHIYHYPIFSWDKAVHGSWMLHGHCHNGLHQYPQYSSVEWQELKIADIGVDAWRFRPVSFYEMKDVMDQRKSRMHKIDWQNAVNNIPDSACVDGFLYWISARNAQIGVYNRERQSFIISRRKFSETYTFDEFHWDKGSPYGTVRPLQRLEKCPIALDSPDMLAYLQEAETRYNVEEHSELVWAVRTLADGLPLQFYDSFSDVLTAKKYMTLVKVDIRNPEIVKLCSERATAELIVPHALQRLKYGIEVNPDFFLGHSYSIDEYQFRKLLISAKGTGGDA
jgi:calcineurin-like phosphoesterase family protein